MKEIRKGYKFKLNPTPTQIQVFYQFVGNTRFVYNQLLDWSATSYKERGESVVNRKAMCARITQLKADYPFLKLSHIHTLQNAADDLISGYKRFFKRLWRRYQTWVTHATAKKEARIP